MSKKSNNTEKTGFQEQFKKDQEEIAVALDTFNIDDFTASAEELLEVSIPKVGVVKYKLLNYDETQALVEKLEKSKITSKEERGFHIIAAMMKKADGKTTVKKIRKLPGGVANKIINTLSKKSSFL